MNWKKATLGVIVAAGMLLTTTLIWDSTRKEPAPVDVLDVWLGAGIERPLATAVGLSSSLNTTTTKVFYATWGGANPHPKLHWTPSYTGALGPVETDYSSAVGMGTYEFVRTNGYYSFSYAGGPVTHDISWWKRDDSKHFVWGPFSNLVVSGMETDYGGLDFDGAYQWTARVSRVDYYRKVSDHNYVIVDYGPGQVNGQEEGCRYGTVFGHVYSAPYYDVVAWTDAGTPAWAGPIFGSSWYFEDSLYSSATNPLTGVSVTGSAFMTNLLSEGVAMSPQMKADALTWEIPRSLVFDIGAKLRSLLVNGCYADDSQASGGDFVGFHAIPSIGTNLFNTLHFGHTMTYNGQPYTMFDDERLDAGSGAISITNHYVTLEALTQRRQVAQAMKWVNRSNVGVSGNPNYNGTASIGWTTNGVDDGQGYTVYQWGGGGYTYADAVTDIQAAEPTKYRGHFGGYGVWQLVYPYNYGFAYPAHYSWCYHQSWTDPEPPHDTLHYYTIGAVAVKMKPYVNSVVTNFNSTVDIYVRADHPVKGNPTFNKVGETDHLEEDEVTVADSFSLSAGESGAYTSNVAYGELTLPSPLASAPAAFKTNYLGWVMEGDGVVVKPTFGHCLP